MPTSRRATFEPRSARTPQPCAAASRAPRAVPVNEMWTKLTGLVLDHLEFADVLHLHMMTNSAKPYFARIVMKKLLEELSMGGFYEPLIQCGVVSIQVLQDEGLISNDELENRIGMGFVHVRKLRRRLRACLTPATHQSLILHQRRRLPRSLPPRRSPRPSRARPRAPEGRSQATSATTPSRRAASGGTPLPPLPRQGARYRGNSINFNGFFIKMHKTTTST